MRKIFGVVTALFVGAIVHANSAQAATVIAADCVSVTDAHGCLFSGNITTATSGSSSYLLAEAAYNLFDDTHPSAQPDITLTPLFNSNDSGFPGTVTGSTSGTWSLPGYAVDFLAVKAADDFVLYEITAASSGSWSTLDIPYTGDPHALSHLVFFGDPVSAVPEPATWALFIVGFGAIGWMLRSARHQRGVSAIV